MIQTVLLFTRRAAVLLAAAMLPGAGLSAAWAGGSELPPGYELYHSVRADFDGDGQPETAYAAQRKEFSVDHPPHLWITRGSQRLLDLWLKDTNALMRQDWPPHNALQTGDLTGDGNPEILFIPSSAGGSGGTQYPRVVFWNGREFANLPLTNRTLRHLSENGGAVLKTASKGKGSLILWETILPGPGRIRAQWFTYQNGKLVGGRERRSTRTRDAGLRELGIR